jgi:hypothetical protein
MTRDLKATQSDVLAALKARGLATTPDALKPLRFIDFKKLVEVHDHEERFLFDTLVASLADETRNRLQRAPGPELVTADDVRQALLDLGNAVARASEQTFAAIRKPLIKDVCPYC